MPVVAVGTTGELENVFTPATVWSPVRFTVSEAFALALRAVCVAVLTGLSASLVLSTLDKPTSVLSSVTAPVLPDTDVTVLTCAPAAMPSSLVSSAVVYAADVASRIALFAWV